MRTATGTVRIHPIRVNRPTVWNNHATAKTPITDPASRADFPELEDMVGEVLRRGGVGGGFLVVV